MAATITVYSKPSCPQCAATYRALDKNGVEYEVIDLTQDPTAFAMVAALGYLQAPIIITATGESWSGFRPDKINAYAKELVPA